jgi:hypothetical protein
MEASADPMDATPPPAPSMEASVDAGKPFPLNQVCAPVNLRGDGGTDAGDDGLACDECSQGNCCDSRKALLAFPDAQDLASCLAPASCGAACSARCFAKYPGPGQALMNHGACKTYQCNDICNAPRAPKESACFACYTQNCFAESLACDLDRDCYVQTACAAPCKDTKCWDACLANFPAGGEVYTRFLTCTQTRCQTECTPP